MLDFPCTKLDRHIYYLAGVILIDNQKGKYLDQFYEAILSLETVEDCHNFFEDVATIAEVKSLAQRFHVAKMLYDGYTYQEIEKQTGASTATISRVKRFLYYGAGGYKKVLDRMSGQDKGEE